MRTVVSGTGRCGTTWLADVLNACGVKAGHEDVYTALGDTGLWFFVRDGVVVDYRVDVSLYAAPFLADHDGPVWHLVREPLACIGSLVGWQLPSSPNAQGLGGEFIAEHLGWTSSGYQIVDSARYWCDWNEMVEGHASRRFQVEALDPGVVAWIVEEITGSPVAPQRVVEAFDRHRPLHYRAAGERAPVPLGWGDIPEPELSRVVELARRYGYPTPDEGIPT